MLLVATAVSLLKNKNNQVGLRVDVDQLNRDPGPFRLGEGEALDYHGGSIGWDSNLVYC